MIKKRLIFTLLYCDGAFMLSRNFRLQRVGDVEWLNRNYNFSNIATSIDELIILDASRDKFDTEDFYNQVEEIVEGCFMPLALGGRVTTLKQASRMLGSGAEKIVLNTALHLDPDFVGKLTKIYGSQCIVGAIDYKMIESKFEVFIDRGRVQLQKTLQETISSAIDAGVGEIYLNSMDKDGTGQGYCMAALEQIPAHSNVPIIMAGGAGNSNHLIEGVRHPKVDAVATANLFNFIGDGIPKARESLLNAGVSLARW